jgi:hypothetical protein
MNATAILKIFLGACLVLVSLRQLSAALSRSFDSAANLDRRSNVSGTATDSRS